MSEETNVSATIRNAVEELRTQLSVHPARCSVAERKRLLRALKDGLEREKEQVLDALTRDLGKPRTEALLTEITVVTSEIDHALQQLDNWVVGHRFSVGAHLLPGRGRIVPEPLGLVLIIAPWNYPLQLALSPLVGAIAAGNAAIVKPSELTPHTSHLLAHLIHTYLDPQWVRVIEGGVQEATELLTHHFDLIFYTGNGTVGRVVARAAAEHLTPTILELGGKSPVFVDEGMDIPVVAKRIAWAKFTNAGQTCVAPDYVMATAPVLDQLTRALSVAIAQLYGSNQRLSEDYGRIVNPRHFSRLSSLITEEHVVLGGGVDPEDRYIQPTVLRGTGLDHPCMKEEIFGPILPLIEVSGPDEAIRIINQGEKPLTLYLFSDLPDVKDAFVQQTSSGSVACGVALAHVGCLNMPFGGVGESGMGSYHGKTSFEAFSHLKPVLSKPLAPDTLKAIYPPYRKMPKVVKKILGL